jgi:hypothetical protein
MLSRIILNTASAELAVEGSVLPCLVKFDGPAPVAEHFTTVDLPPAEDAASAAPIKEAYFRGRKLLSISLSLPENYTAYVLDASSQAQSQPLNKDDEEDAEMEEVRTFKAQAEMSKVTVYGNSTLPDASSPHLKIEAWIALAKVLHNA